MYKRVIAMNGNANKVFRLEKNISDIIFFYSYAIFVVFFFMKFQCKL